MSHYQVIIPKPVQKQLDKLPKKEFKRVIKCLINLRDNPRPDGCLKLRGYENEYRLRIGNYRVRYEIRSDNRVIVILHCLHRKDIYRR